MAAPETANTSDYTEATALQLCHRPLGPWGSSEERGNSTTQYWSLFLLEVLHALEGALLALLVPAVHLIVVTRAYE
jgi:hypothetical protein